MIRIIRYIEGNFSCAASAVAGSREGEVGRVPPPPPFPGHHENIIGKSDYARVRITLQMRNGARSLYMYHDVCIDWKRVVRQHLVPNERYTTNRDTGFCTRTVTQKLNSTTSKIPLLLRKVVENTEL